MDRLVSLFGIVRDDWHCVADELGKARFPWRVVIGGLLLQFGFAPSDSSRRRPGQAFFDGVDGVFNKLMDCVDAGSSFVFGQNFKDHYFAFRVLPSIIFFAALMQALYYVGVMQWIVRGLGWVVQRTLGTTGPESLAAAANIFLGQTEAPLVVRPYVKKMTKSELMAIMVPGFGSTAGGVLIAYKGMGIDAGHLLTASVLSAPASLLIAKVMLPETETPEPVEKVEWGRRLGGNLVEAVSWAAGRASQRGTLVEAIVGHARRVEARLMFAAMLISFWALIALGDGWSVGSAVGLRG